MLRTPDSAFRHTLFLYRASTNPRLAYGGTIHPGTGACRPGSVYYYSEQPLPFLAQSLPGLVQAHGPLHPSAPLISELGP